MTPTENGPTPAIDWRAEVAVAVRDGFQCRQCEVVIVEDVERSFVRIDLNGGDDLDNVALVCAACRNGHAVHPQPIPPYGDRTPALT